LSRETARPGLRISTSSRRSSALVSCSAASPARASERGRGRARPPQDRPHARQQLARVERLGEVVVGAELEAAHAIDVVAARGQDQHRTLAVAPQLDQHVEAGLQRQHHVEDREVELARPQRAGAGLAVVHRLDLQALLAEEIAEHRAQFAIVFDQQDPRLGGRRHGKLGGTMGNGSYRNPAGPETVDSTL